MSTPEPVACLVPHGDSGEQRLRLWCPGCNTWHDPTIGPGHWTWDGSQTKPTLSPSIKAQSRDENGPTVCHSFVREGVWEFLSDCTHALAGQKVPCPPASEWEWGWYEPAEEGS